MPYLYMKRVISVGSLIIFKEEHSKKFYIKFKNHPRRPLFTR